MIGKSLIERSNKRFGDDSPLAFGPAKLLWETADPNANALVLALPDGGAVDVPVFVIGDQSILNANLAAHDGVVEPTVAIWNAAGDAYVSLDSGDDAVATNKGLYFSAAADEDIELINLSVDGTPRIYWNEASNRFHSTKGFYFDGACIFGAGFAVDDQDYIGLGTEGDTLFGYENADANAKMLHMRLPLAASDASNVPVLAIFGGVGVTGDLGTTYSIDFSGRTEPLVVILDADTDSWIGYGFSADDVPAIMMGGNAAGLGLGSQFFSFTEMAAPGAGAANTARIYALEGGGDALTDLCAVFQDGTIDVFAQEATKPDAPIFQFPDNTELGLKMLKPDRRTVQFVATFPDGRDFVMREIRYPEDRWN